MRSCFIIAEAGVNHNGSLDLALKLADAAREAGADAVKFQTFKADLLTSAGAGLAAYQKATQPKGFSQLEMLRRLEIGPEFHRKLVSYCQRIGIEFLSSAFDERSADLLAELGVRIFKVPSGEITNLPYLHHLARMRKPAILSTGMSTLGEVEEAVDVFRSHAVTDLTLLHCVTEYPAPFDQVNLRAMLTLGAAFGVPVGYSDHTPGIEIAIAAVALGACVIEKHLTLDRSLPGPDQAASLEPAEFGRMISAIRNVEKALGTGIKAPAPCERPNLVVARKSVVAMRDLAKGHQIEAADLGVKRPGDGVPPKMLPFLIGRTLRVDVARDEVITWSHLV